MSGASPRSFISVKFAPVGRTYSFLLPELDLDKPGSSDDRTFGSSEDREPGNSDLPLPELPNVRPSERPSSRTSERPTVRSSDPPVFNVGDSVIVQTPDGPAIGTVTRAPEALLARRQPPADSPARVIRKATRDDVVARLKLQQREKEAHRICLMKIRERGLAMKLAQVEQIFDGSRLIFYYTAEGRVDFRELVRDLAAHFRTRIEMRQIGVRDEARMLGGYGSCGRPLCCTTWLQSFEPISIKMAKQQKLSLNPSKLSGMCGRLKCCLRYELPNGKGVKHGGCADEGGCGTCSNPTGPGGGCGSCSSGSCSGCHR
jgi:cell fate regulator YaaT (PSP1 superfamily)